MFFGSSLESMQVGGSEWRSRGEGEIDHWGWGEKCKVGWRVGKDAWVDWHNEEFAVEYDEREVEYFETEHSAEGEAEAEWGVDRKIIRSRRDKRGWVVRRVIRW